MPENMPIESTTKTVQKCLKECLYEVPNFQRPYSWSTEQLEDYWSDVINAESDFFFGTTVTWVSERRELFNDTFALIDGQQRLTTSIIALSVFRDAFSMLASSHEEGPVGTISRRQFEVTQGYIVIQDDRGDEYPTLRRPEEMFWESIQSPNSIPSGATWDRSASRLGAAREFFERKIQNLVSDPDCLEATLDRLREYRDNALRARLIQVELSSEEDAFLIFETLNTRGAELLLSDVVKNMLVRGAGPRPADQEAVAKRWKAIERLVVSDGESGESLDRFIWQSWNSRRSALKEPELYKAAKKRLGTSKEGHLEYLGELETDSNVFQFLDSSKIDFPKSTGSKRDALAVVEVQDSITALGLFNVSVANSAVMALVRKYNSSHLITRSQLVSTLKNIENFHFQYNQLTRSGSTGGTRGRYNRFAVLLEEASSKDEVRNAIAELSGRLSASLPPRQAAIQGFSEIIYAPKLRLNAAQKKRGRSSVVKYVLLKLASSGAVIPGGQNPATWTIEHIKPQATAENGAKDPVYSIGNLAVLTAEANGQLADGTLGSKRRDLEEKVLWKDLALREWLDVGAGDVVTEDMIARRTSYLAQHAVDEVWTVKRGG